MVGAMSDEDERTVRLLDAQANAIALFDEVAARGLVAAGQREQAVSDQVRDRVIEADDIAFADFGPIFDEFEADLGRTYVIGGDPVKQRLAADLPVIFDAGRRYFADHAEITGAELYAEITRLADAAGWSFGNIHSGHLVGEFPHEEIDGEDIESYIASGNDTPMRRHDAAGRVCHWILEIHLIDPERQFGGFYEQLLDLG